MNKIIALVYKFKWYLIVAFGVILSYIIHAFGRSDKKADYGVILENYKETKHKQIEKRVEDLQNRSISKDVENIKEKELDNINLKQELESRLEKGRFPQKKTTKEIINDLENIGY
jgi:hypothetical protein